jgi:glycosyltransferase involved in cell wall biosynthesis
VATRVLFICPTLGVGGAERQLAHLVVQLRQHGIKPIVATLGERGRHFDEIRGDVPTLHLAVSSRVDIRGMVRTLRLARTDPDVVFSQGMNAQFLGSLVARRARSPHVTVEHGGAGFERGWHRRMLTRVVAHSVERIVCVSETQVSDLTVLGYARSAISVIPNGIPDLRPDGSRAEERQRLGFEDSDVVVLLVAVLRPEKRPDVFVEGVRQAHARNAAVRGLVVGGGPLYEATRASAARTGGVVRLLGERTDIATLMSCADVVCLTSDVEAMPLTMLEAMAVGRPIVANAVGGLTEIVRTGETGLLVPRDDPPAFADAVLELAADPKRRLAMGVSGRARFEREYTFERMVDRYAELLTDVASRAGGRRRPPNAM